ncbi:hypothetical protein NMG60_11036373 [Bertholletia excelsa]
MTPPLKLESESDSSQDYYKVPNLLQRILSLLKNIHPGADLTHFPVPPTFNIPKSMLQCYGESVYCTGKDLLSECAKGKSPMERFIGVVAWSISTTRPLMFGVSPYNPILGETHHVSRGSLNVLLEQVSHHPPVSALHATDQLQGIDMIWCHRLTPKFNGASVEAGVHGKRQLKLMKHEENYVIDHPNLLIKFLPVPGVHWVGSIHCPETSLAADLCFGGGSSFIRHNHRSIKGKIFSITSSPSPNQSIFQVNGHWDRTVTIKDVNNGKETVIYDAKEVLSGLKTPVLKESEKVWTSESAAVWAEVSRNIMSKCWDKAGEAKTAVEERERELVRARKTKGETWVPKHFTLSSTKEAGLEWDCVPNQQWVPPAPIFVPI